MFFYDFPKIAKSQKSAKNAKGTLTEKGAGQEGGPARLNGAAGMLMMMASAQLRKPNFSMTESATLGAL